MLDQYYTKPEIAELCFKVLSKNFLVTNYYFIEPSAGTGVWLNILDKNNLKYKAFDIEPKDDRIIKQDFLKLELKTNKDKTIIVGNPPFGKNANLAVKFFNKATNFASIIAFILPKSFNTFSIQNRLHKKYHLINTINLPLNSFIYKDKDYNVEAVFQIWMESSYKRQVKKYKNTELLSFIKDKEEADLVIRRVGVNAGLIPKNGFSPNSNYFIKCDNNLKTFLIKNQYKLNKIAKNKGIIPTLSKYDLLEFINEYYNEEKKKG